jgi:hypothetical protein
MNDIKQIYIFILIIMFLGCVTAILITNARVRLTKIETIIDSMHLDERQ